MKKALSLMLAVLMLVSLLVVPVYAGEDDGFNDGQFGQWGDGETPDVPEAPVFNDNPYDPLDNWNVVSERTADTLEWFNHPEMAGLSVAMRAPAALTSGSESSFTYKNDGHVATAISVAAVMLDGWTFDLAVSGRAAGGEWAALDYVTSAMAEIPGASNPGFKRGVATVTVPENVEEVKIALVNTGAAWTFAIDYVDIQWEATTPDTPDPIEGSLENPIYVPMGQSAPTSLILAAGQSVYYQLKAAVFNGYSIIARIPSAVTVDGTRYDAYSPADYGIRVPLELTPMSPAIVGFHNETEDEMEISIDWEMPLGTETDPYQLENGDNAISIPVNYPVYYAAYVPTAVGDYTLTASDFENFMITVDVDGDPATTEDQFPLTENYVFTCTESYIPVFFIVQPVGITPDVTLSITPPAKGTENNPYSLSSYEEIQAGLSGEGDATWPATADGVYYALDGWTFMNTVLRVTGTAPLSVTINGTTWTETVGDVVTLEIQMELNDDQYQFATLIKSASDVQLDVVYPEGTMYNPIDLNKGKNTLHLDEFGNVVYATYTAEKDGVLIIKPNTVNGLGYTDAFNATREDYENGYDFISAGYEIEPGVIEGASDDNVLTIPVSTGDVVNITTCAGENEDFEILAMDLVLTVGYEGDSVVTITSESATASYAKMGGKVSAKVTATGDGLKYQWYIKNDGKTSYSKSSVTSATYSTTMSDKAKNRRVYCVVSDMYGNEVKSKTFILRESVSITKEPATAAYAKKGAKVSVKLTASGDGLKYQWYIKNDGKTSYSKSSVTSSTYSVTMSSKVKGRRLYCVVTDKYGKKVQSKTFILRESVSIVTQPKTVTVAKNKTAKVTVKASGDGLKYTWYIKNDGAKKYSKSSITKSSYSVTMTSKVKNRLVYCVVTDKYGKTVKSTTVRLKMK